MTNVLLSNSLAYPILSVVLLTPLAGAACCFFIRNQTVLKLWGLLVTLMTAALSLPLWTAFDRSTAAYQFVEVLDWFPTIGLSYQLGVDGISVLLVLLTTLIMPLCILCSWKYIEHRLAEFIFAILVMETAMIGVFVSLNTVLFYIFWEAMLIPMYLLIAVWGGPRKDYAAIKFFLYTFVASIFFLVAIIALRVKVGTFFIPDLMAASYSFGWQAWIFAGCALAFAVKIPMFPFHTWLPAAHVEAPTAGSVILASILLKMGGYGFLRFCLPMAPQATEFFAPFLIVLSLVGILYGGYLALGQSDIKKLIAYSSVGHMGFVTLGIFLLNMEGLKGAMLQMINHGITTGALFICIGIIYERTHSRELQDNAALGMFMPVYVTFLGIFSLSSLAFPGTNSFVGEFLVLMGAFRSQPLVGAIAIPGAILAAAYMLRMLQKMVWDKSDGHAHAHSHGEAALEGLHGHEGEEGGHGDGHSHGHERKLWDLDLREMACLAFLVVFVFWIGLHPQPVLSVMDASISHLLEQVAAGQGALGAGTGH
jgi:NADH-quinone oxidoreductase subunit M